MTLVERHVPGQQMKKSLLCNFHYSEARLFCSNRELSLLCTESSSFLPKNLLSQDNPSLPPLDFAVLAEPKHQALDVLLEDSHESWQLQPAFWRTQITKLCVAGRTFTVSSHNYLNCKGHSMFKRPPQFVLDLCKTPSYTQWLVFYRKWQFIGCEWAWCVLLEDIPLDPWCSRKRARHISHDSGWNRCSWSRCLDSSRPPQKHRNTPTVRRNRPKKKKKTHIYVNKVPQKWATMTNPR